MRWVISARLFSKQIGIRSERPPSDGGKKLCEVLHLGTAGKRQGFSPGLGHSRVGMVCRRLANGSVPAPHAVRTIRDTRRRCVQQAPINGPPGGVVAMGLA